jgi:type III secretion HrpO family protein
MLMFYVKQALWITLLVGGPLVIFTMIVGLTLGFLQAVLQLQDQAFPFGVKLIGSILILMIAGPWLASTMMEFTIGVFSMFDQI